MTTKPMSNKEKQRLRAERAAAALKEKQRRERRRQMLTAIGVVVAIALIVGAGFLINSMRDDTKETAAKIPPPGSQYGLTIGSADAPHQVVVYEDFLCPFCGEFEKASHEQLAQLADDGKVQVEYRPFVLLNEVGPYSARATLIWSLVLAAGRRRRRQEVPRPAVREPAERAGPVPEPGRTWSRSPAQAGADTDQAADRDRELRGRDRLARGRDQGAQRPRRRQHPDDHPRRGAVHQDGRDGRRFGNEPDQGASVTP